MICCVGSAHIDILAKQNGFSGVDQAGDIHVSIGGTAYNIACNLKKHGTEVAIVTVVKGSIFGRMIVQKLNEYKIITDWVIEDLLIKESLFISISNADELTIAVNSIAIEDYHITQIPEASAYFVDLNNGLDTVRSVLVRERPTYIGLVSEDKSTKLIPILLLPESTNIKTVSGNAKEFNRLLKEMGLASMEELSVLYPYIEFLYTMGKEGLKVFKSGQVVCEDPGLEIKTDKHIQGAGDALISGYMFAREIELLSIKESIDFAITQSVILKLLTCGANLMENSLDSFDNIVYVDQLTRLHNRHFYEKRKSQITGSYSVIIADIDRFKSINDTFGHEAGDVVLRQVANIIRENVRASDIVIRWGGEEFVVFCQGKQTEAVVVAERLRQAIQSTPIVYNEHVINVTASFGVSATDESISVNEAIVCADKLLYKAKKSGRNKVEFLPETFE